MRRPRRRVEERPDTRAGARSDAELLGEVRRGDPSALGELYDRHARSVWRAVQRILGNGADAEDVVQALFLKLPEVAASFDGRASAGPWLIGIGARIALRHRRGMGRFLKMVSSFGETWHATGRTARDPETESSQREEVRAFEAALASLAPKKRAVFTLIELEGLTTDEVAAALEIPAATVRTRLHHARLELQAALDRTRGT